jgi:hypothetical protein
MGSGEITAVLWGVEKIQQSYGGVEKIQQSCGGMGKIQQSYGGMEKIQHTFFTLVLNGGHLSGLGFG